MAAAVEGGTIWLLYLFDVADWVDLERARVLAAEWGARRGATTLRGPDIGTGGVVLTSPPVDLDIGSLNIEGITGRVAIRLFDFGVASVRIGVPIEPGTTSEDLIRTAARVERLAGAVAAARSSWKRVAEELADALNGAHEVDLVEDYVLFEITGVSGVTTAREALAELDPARLLLAEPERPLAPQVCERYLARALQYYADDAAVIDWNAAVVIDPEGSRDELEVLEIATARLLELRYYDRLLARELAGVYTMAEAARGSYALFRSPFVKVAQRASTLFVEMADLYDRIEGGLTLVGDAYTARLYREAAQRFRLEEISMAVREKLGTLSRVTEAFQAEIGHRRGLLLEGAVVVLIVLELLLAVIRSH